MSDNNLPAKARTHRALTPGSLSPVVLAFMGDTVYETLVRNYLIRNYPIPPAKLHRAAIKFVNAGAQSKAVEFILPMLSDEEHDILRRGRNANTSHVPKNANPLDYRHATGLEALFGYLSLNDRYDRILEIFDVIIKNSEEIEI